MPDNLVGDIEGANGALSKMERLLDKLTLSAIKFTNTMSNGMQNTGNSGTGSRGLGVGSNPNIMGQSLGGFSLTPPMGSVAATWQWTKNMNLGLNAAQGGIRALTGLVAGGFGAMPDVETTTARSSAFYGASLLQGMGPNGRTKIGNATFSAMRGGISGLGMDAATAGILSSYGVSATATGVNAGQFSNLARSTANAAKYLNIDNATAAQALGGLTQGGTSSALMRNFGIYTTNPITGERLSPTSIFAQLNQRITGGQKLSVEDLKTSMQGGALAQDLQLSGLDPTQQRLAYQYMLDKAAGKKMDLGSDKTMAKLQREAGINPDQAGYSATTSQTATMNAASDAYIKGMQKAAGVIDKFNTAMQGFLKSPMGEAMAEMNGGTNLAFKDPTIAGGMTALGGAFGGLGQIGGAMLQNAMLTRTLTRAGVLGGGKGAAGAIGRGARTGTGFKAGKAGAVAAGVLGAVNLAQDAMSGKGVGTKQFNSDLGGTVGGIAGGILGTALDPFTFGMGTFIGAGLGGWAGSAIGGMFGSGGEGSTIASGSTSATGSVASYVNPVPKGSKVTLQYGVYDANHPNGHWGIDYGVALGTTVMAVTDGKVTYAGGGNQNTYPNGSRTLGTQVWIKHSDGLESRYGHLSGYGVNVGDTVKAGQVIGKSGNSGFSTGPHLHFEMKNAAGSPVNPNDYIGGNFSSGFGNYQDSATSANSSNSSSSSGIVADAGGMSNLTGFSDTTTSPTSGVKTPGAYKGAEAASSGGSTGVVIGQGASSTNTGGSVGNGQGGAESGSRGGVVINVSVAQASESEARRFAKLIKEYLDADALTSNMGRL